MEQNAQKEVFETARETDPILIPQDRKLIQASRDEYRYFVFWALLLIITSAGLISYQKDMMRAEVFPFAVPLVMIQMAGCTILGAVGYSLCPGMYPFLREGRESGHLDCNVLFKCMTPIAFCQASSYALSNTAYKYASVAFLQMMKQSNVFLVYGLSLIVGLEVFHGTQVVLLCGVVGACYVTLTGELHFSTFAFFTQGGCCFAESSRVVLQGLLLGPQGKRLDPMSCVLIVCPQVFAILTALAISQWAFEPTFLEWLTWPTRAQIVHCRYLIAGNIILAFGLNVVTAYFLRYGSPLGFLLTNICKDAIIVLASSVLMMDPISSVQCVSFPIQLLLILTYSLTKTYPKTFKHEGLSGLLPAVAKGTAQ
jgi:hypothetical protein